MERFVKQVWIAVGIASVALLAAWLTGELLYGLLVIGAGIVLGVFLAHLSRLWSRLTGLSYQVAYAVMVLAVFAVAVGVFTMMGTQIAEQAGEFVRQLRESAGQLDKQLQSQAWWTEVKNLRSSVADLLSLQKAVSTATSAVTSTISALGGAVLVLFLGLYFAVQPERYRNGLLSLVPPAKRKRVREVTDQATAALWYWILGRLAGMIVIGVGSAVGLWLFGVPLSVSLGVLAGVLTFIPNLGPLRSCPPCCSACRWAPTRRCTW